MIASWKTHTWDIKLIKKKSSLKIVLVFCFTQKKEEVPYILYKKMLKSLIYVHVFLTGQTILMTVLSIQHGNCWTTNMTNNKIIVKKSYENLLELNYSLYSCNINNFCLILDFFFITKKILQKIIFRLLKQTIDAKFVEGYMVM